MDVTTQGMYCKISDDNMSVSLSIEPPKEDCPYMVEDITAFLRLKGVTSGFSYSTIEAMIKNGTYNEYVVVASGSAPVDGVDGYYDFFFSTGKMTHPTIRSDGSVDYQSMNVVHSVQAGDVLAVYHKSVAGHHGYDVKGRELRCKPSKELPEIKGNGFEIEADGLTYVATMEGRVEYDNFKLFIRDIYEIKGDLDILTGRVDFRGDVVIHGSVRAGTYIRASRSITIEGNVEAAILIAEGDIVLKKGMQGGSKAKIISGGSVYAYFLEYTEVSAKGSVEANIILNCKITAGKSIKVSGKKGLMVGGSYYAASMLSSMNMGNPAQARTICSVGLSGDIATRNHLLMTKLEATKKGMANAKQAIATLSDARLSSEPKEVRNAKINQLRRKINRDERLISHLEKEVEEIRQTMEYCKDASVIVAGNSFPGVVVRIDDRELSIERQYTHVKFMRPSKRDDIEICNLG